MSNFTQHLQRYTSVSFVMKLCVNKGKYLQALQIYDKIDGTERNEICDALALKACIHTGNFNKGKQIHKQIECYLHQNQYLQSTLINLYGENSDITNAMNIFKSIDKSKRDIVIITSMMKAYINNGFNKEALELYDKNSFNDLNASNINKKKDKPIAHLLALKACTNLTDYEKGKEIHSIINSMNIDNNDHITTELINFYGHCGDTENAIKVFNSNMNNSKSMICIGSMLTAYNNNDKYLETLKLYEMSILKQPNIKRNDTSLLQALKACINTSNITKGTEIAHLIGRIMNDNTVQLKTALISFYSDIGDIDQAIDIFNSIDDRKKDIFAIDVMMEAYCNHNLYNECLELYRDLNKINDNIKPDLLTFINVFKACTHETCYYFGKMVHDKLKEEVIGRYILRHKDIQIGLISFYGKCGVMEKCDEIFDNIEKYEFDKYVSEIGIWNAMIHGYGRNGDIQKARDIYDTMINEIGMMPDSQTYVALINAYNNCGDIEQGQRIWKYEIIDDNIKYDEYVMTVLIDGMSKYGLLKESKQLIIKYHCKCQVMWMSLLSACHKHKQLDILNEVYNEIKKRFNHDTEFMTSASVLISNAYASTSIS